MEKLNFNNLYTYPSASEPALVHLNAAGEVDYTNGSTTTKYKVYVYPITNGAEVEFKNLTIKKA